MVHSDYAVGRDAHKHFSLFAVLDDRGELLQRTMVGHAQGEIRSFLCQFPECTPVALETVGSWYSRRDAGTVWIVDETEIAGFLPLLTHSAKAKIMMGNIRKTDKLGAHWLATLLYQGKLPSVWIPPADVRDERELPRTRHDLLSTPDPRDIVPMVLREEPHPLHPVQICPFPRHRQRHLRYQVAA